jgi:UDP-2,3-diacylglucosamine pyrophosphatase LpxH
MHASAPTPNDYILLSDVHLGADLVQHAQPWTVSRLRRMAKVDLELSALLDHYRASAPEGRRWRLVIAGDLVDFVGMSIAPLDDAALETPLDAEERAHGLGSARDRAFLKMRAVARRHDLVFRALTAFVADGHSLVLVRGNHDVEFYWESAQEAFVEALVERAGAALADPEARAVFEARIEFRPWFYYVENLLYVEHGHQYDETCAYHHVLAPLSPRNPDRIGYSFSDILLRYVVRPTRGLRSEGHENRTMAHYVTWGLSLGWRGATALGLRYARAVREMFRSWRDHRGDGMRLLRAEQERLLTRIARQRTIAVDTLRALAALAATPVTSGAWKIMQSVFLDLALGSGVAVLVLGAVGLLQLTHSGVLPGLAALFGVALWLWLRGARVHDPGLALRRGAARIAQLLPTRFVVMGHTHQPVVEALGATTTYVNLGAWAEEDLDDEGPLAPAPRTHLVIRQVDDAARAELMTWDTALGPRPFCAGPADPTKAPTGPAGRAGEAPSEPGSRAA